MKLPRGPVITSDQSVYVMSVPSLGYFKIGRSGDPVGRVSELQCGCPERIELIGASTIDPEGLPAFRFEFELHRALAAHRSHGEWFGRITLESVLHTWGVVWNDLVDFYHPPTSKIILQMTLPFE